MKVYFTCSTADFLTHRDTYYRIRELILEENHVLTMDWLDKANDRLKKRKFEMADIKDVYRDCMHAINDADLVIVEDTVSNFSTGHQITVALQKQKPTLVLWQGPKHRHFQQTFIQGIESDILQVKEYSLETAQDIIHAFTRKYKDVGLRNRFHLVLSDVERSYLDWAQFTKNKSRTRIIRDALKKEIDGDDDYEQFLSTSS